MRIVKVNASKKYNIYIDRGLLSEAGEYIREAAGGNRAFGPVYIYAAVCILFAAGSGIYCVLSGKAREMIFLLICIAAAGAGLAVQNLLAEGKTLNLILQFNHSGLAHIAGRAVLPLTYIWCNRIISRYK